MLGVRALAITTKNKGADRRTEKTSAVATAIGIFGFAFANNHWQKTLQVPQHHLGLVVAVLGSRFSDSGSNEDLMLSQTHSASGPEQTWDHLCMPLLLSQGLPRPRPDIAQPSMVRLPLWFV